MPSVRWTRTGGVAVKAIGEHIIVELSPDELELIRAGLKMLLHAEDDPDTIAELKRLLERLGDDRD
jgi:hypothetical protein